MYPALPRGYDALWLLQGPWFSVLTSNQFTFSQMSIFYLNFQNSLSKCMALLGTHIICSVTFTSNFSILILIHHSNTHTYTDNLYHTYTNTHTYTCAHTEIYTHTHTNTHANMHTQMHTQTHTHIIFQDQGVHSICILMSWRLFGLSIEQIFLLFICILVFITERFSHISFKILFNYII